MAKPYDRVNGTFYHPKFSHNLYKDAITERKIDEVGETLIDVLDISLDLVGTATGTKPITDIGSMLMNASHDIDEFTDPKNPINDYYRNYKQADRKVVETLMNPKSLFSNMQNHLDTNKLSSNRTDGQFMSETFKDLYGLYGNTKK